MLIQKMTATFGCLDGAVLELQPGLNVLVLPNEQGKSTWSAFLLAMFYGIDTSRRSARGRLSEKERYQPWNGKPMSGTMELEVDGKHLVIQRTSDRGKPMGTFRAYDRDTGLNVPGLTADNCGQVLLGVERSVFERTAFLRGSELAVTQEQDLARRLNALATTGEAEDSYPEAEKQLKLWQNRCRYHKTGRIPETEEQLCRVQASIKTVDQVRSQRLDTNEELAKINQALKAAQGEELRQNQGRRERLRTALEQAHIRYEQKLACTSKVPEEERLRQLLTALEGKIPSAGKEPPCPEALRELDAAGLWPQIERDLRRYEVLTSMDVRGSCGVLVSAILGTALGIGLLVLQQWWMSAVALIASGLCFWSWIRIRRHNKEVKGHLAEAQAMLDSYGARTKEEMLTAAVRRREWLLCREQAEQAAWTQELTLEEVRTFAPEADSAEQGKEAIEAALQNLRELQDAEYVLERARLQCQLAGEEWKNPQVQQLCHSQIQLEAKAEGLLRQEEVLGDWDALHSEQDALQAQLEQLQLKERAISLAREALASANAEMTQAYAPQLTSLAGEAFKELTQGRYDALIFREDLELSVREASTGLVRPLASLSRGTQDETWLALRLAMTKLLLPEGTPLVLDDALLTFDQQREQAAMNRFKQKQRQILLFSCR